MPNPSAEELIEAERWSEARKLLRTQLRSKPESHWLLTRLALTYYEERSYERALKYSEMAVHLAPACPLALWDYAGALQMVGRHNKALSVYARIIGRGVQGIAHDECGEGIAWARGLIADCYLRTSDSFAALGRQRDSHEALVHHLDLRGPGCRSIYPLNEVRAKAGHQISRRKRTRRKPGAS